MKEIIKKYREIILYLFVGGATTLVNIVFYWLFYNIIGIDNVAAAVLAQIVSIIFAFFGNKVYVFQSKTRKRNEIIKEAVSFFSCRALTAVLDVLIMYVAVDLLKGHALLWKIISNVLVIVLNYIASKLLIFKKK